MESFMPLEVHNNCNLPTHILNYIPNDNIETKPLKSPIWKKDSIF